MKRVLIVSPRFPPAVAPDYHRVRMMLPYLREFGWDPVVLCVDAQFTGNVRDDELRDTIPVSVEIVRTSAISEKRSRAFGIGALWLRAGIPFAAAGRRILREHPFDLVFFSTTEFPLISLGPHWKRAHRVAYVVDFQDPWVNPYYAGNDRRPPGGRLKHGVHQVLARHQERTVVRDAAHIVLVSPSYESGLLARYPALSRARCSVIPFAGSPDDFHAALAGGKGQRAIAAPGNRLEWVYAGAIAPPMIKPLKAFLESFRRAIDRGIIAPGAVHINFIGTNYQSNPSPRVMPIAREYGLVDHVTEIPERIGYLETLRCLDRADALLIFGSDEPGYNASKLYSYILARKPLLAIFHADSPVTAAMRAAAAGVAVAFDNTEPISVVADRITAEWYESDSFRRTPETNWPEVERHSARAMTRRVADIFDEASGG